MVAGCGFLGEAVADALHSEGWEVTAWTASPASAERLAALKPYAVAACDFADGAALSQARASLPEMALVIHCASSGRGGAEQYRRVFLGGARGLIEAFPAARFLFTSSTSVYAQTDGAWVDENSPAEPERETGRILRETEEAVLAAGGTAARLSGIYGPGRSVQLQKFLEGTATIENDGGRWLNHIHRDDAASALLRLASPEAAPGIYNVSDGAPITQIDFYRRLAAHFGKPLPPSGAADLQRKRAWTSKRVRNERLRALGWTPRFSAYIDWAMQENHAADSHAG